MRNNGLLNHPLFRAVALVSAPALMLALAGCTSNTPKLDAAFGDSLQKAKEAQQIAPTAAQRKTPAPSATSAEVQRAVAIQSAGGLPTGGASATPATTPR